MKRTKSGFGLEDHLTALVSAEEGGRGVGVLMMVGVWGGSFKIVDDDGVGGGVGGGVRCPLLRRRRPQDHGRRWPDETPGAVGGFRNGRFEGERSRIW